MNLNWTPRVWSQGSADSGDLLSYPSLPELDSFYRELQDEFPRSVALEKAGHSVQGRPIRLLTITDQDIDDAGKQRVLMVGARAWAGTQRQPGATGTGSLAGYAGRSRNPPLATDQPDAGGQP